MQRKKALATAATAAVTLSAAALAAAANLGLLSRAGDDTVGQLNATNVSELVTPSTTAAPRVRVVYEGEGETSTTSAIVNEPEPAAESPGALANGDGSESGPARGDEGHEDGSRSVPGSTASAPAATPAVESVPSGPPRTVPPAALQTQPLPVPTTAAPPAPTTTSRHESEPEDGADDHRDDRDHDDD